jgi:hypothetical protein
VVAAFTAARHHSDASDVSWGPVALVGHRESSWVRRRLDLSGLWVAVFSSHDGVVGERLVLGWGGRSPSASCRRWWLYQLIYATIATSSWLWVRHTRSAISSVLKVSTNPSGERVVVRVAD